jgi:hypothetical protein
MLNKLAVNISSYFFLTLFLGFFGCTVFFNHTHIAGGNIILHSHPFKPDLNGNPLHSHNPEEYQLINLLDHFTVSIVMAFSLASVMLFLSFEFLFGSGKSPVFGIFRDQLFPRGPPYRLIS